MDIALKGINFISNKRPVDLRLVAELGHADIFFINAKLFADSVLEEDGHLVIPLDHGKCILDADPVFLYPLKPAEALAAFMKIDKKKLLKAEKEAKDESGRVLF